MPKKTKTEVTEVSRGDLREWHFPRKGVTVEARNYEEALEALNNLNK